MSEGCDFNRLLKIIESLTSRIKNFFSKESTKHNFIAPVYVKIISGDDMQVLRDMSDKDFTEFALKMTKLNFDRIELSYTIKGDSFYNETADKTFTVNLGRTIVLHKQAGKFVLLFFDDNKRTMYNLIYDRHIYCNVDSKEVREIPVNEVKFKEYMIHPDDSTIIGELHLLLEKIVNPYEVVDKYNVWGWDICRTLPRKYARLKKEKGLIEA